MPTGQGRITWGSSTPRAPGAPSRGLGPRWSGARDRSGAAGGRARSRMRLSVFAPSARDRLDRRDGGNTRPPGGGHGPGGLDAQHLRRPRRRGVSAGQGWPVPHPPGFDTATPAPPAGVVPSHRPSTSAALPRPARPRPHDAPWPASPPDGRAGPRGRAAAVFPPTPHPEPRRGGGGTFVDNETTASGKLPPSPAEHGRASRRRADRTPQDKAPRDVGCCLGAETNGRGGVDELADTMR